MTQHLETWDTHALDDILETCLCPEGAYPDDLPGTTIESLVPRLRKACQQSQPSGQEQLFGRKP